MSDQVKRYRMILEVTVAQATRLELAVHDAAVESKEDAERVGDAMDDVSVWHRERAKSYVELEAMVEDAWKKSEQI